MLGWRVLDFGLMHQRLEYCIDLVWIGVEIHQSRLPWVLVGYPLYKLIMECLSTPGVFES